MGEIVHLDDFRARLGSARSAEPTRAPARQWIALVENHTDAELIGRLPGDQTRQQVHLFPGDTYLCVLNRGSAEALVAAGADVVTAGDDVCVLRVVISVAPAC